MKSASLISAVIAGILSCILTIGLMFGSYFVKYHSLLLYQLSSDGELVKESLFPAFLIGIVAAIFITIVVSLLIGILFVSLSAGVNESIQNSHISQANINNASTSMVDKFCSSCGEKIKANAEICPKCGVRQMQAPATVKSERSKTTAAIFALLLGSWGIHKFYLGRPIAGILYIVFCWTLIPTIIGIIEGIIYLSMSEAAFKGKYCQ